MVTRTCRGDGVDSQSTHDRRRQRQLKVNPDGIDPLDAAALDSSFFFFVTN